MGAPAPRLRYGLAVSWPSFTLHTSGQEEPGRDHADGVEAGDADLLEVEEVAPVGEDVRGGPLEGGGHQRRPTRPMPRERPRRHDREVGGVAPC
jgi:hypothetical protein